ncbi:MAG TPA: exodeoxyribonuclease VII large subunit [Mesotoga sp.]|jgi:exodeoxyribonuclease VII large subunit|nr:exodeoxyribonuclease VII large subunit [Mesotoga sp.]MDI9376404.1 exodeoxyribonuclease VII large subunit [Thermotogota bacterium]NLX33925.1 exodeoxyribonuclease VII large subunit [Thermotogaceae bacterium]MDD4039551.1 exodeoxyribonuclease VII large subunit [Mesotoga sp.]MDD5743193.1 exodeoxyribonuclease VII large subunit [Mesotoga sp.]
MEELTIEFKDIENMLEHIRSVLVRVGLNNLRVKFPADVTNVGAKGNYVYINVSQDYTERGAKRKIDLNMIADMAAFGRMGRQLGLKSSNELKGKKWQFQGTISFYKPRASFSIWIDTIAPLGESDITVRRREIYAALKSNNALRTEEHELSELQPIRKIAVISSATAAGLGDFYSNLNLKEPYRPVVHLYESFMQGSETVPGILKALNMIKTSLIAYDVVVITRGGGSAIDLMYFDDLDLGMAISAFSRDYCPILSAIGHERDFTIPDFVSWKRFDTPTAAAKAITEQINTHSESLNQAAATLKKEMEWLFEKTSTLAEFERLREFATRVETLIERSDEQFETVAERTSRRLLSEIERAASFIDSLDRDSYAITIERTFERVLILTDSLFERASTILDRHLKESASALDKVNVDVSMDSLLFRTDTSLDLFEKGVLRSFERVESNAVNNLEELSSGLVEHGGYAASLLLGGVVLKRDSHVVRSAREVTRGDRLECYFADGCATTIIDEVTEV